MYLQDYQNTISEIVKSELPDHAKGTALAKIADEIDSCLWNPWAKEEAAEVAGLAREESNKFGGWSPDGLDYLGENGFLA